MPSTCRCARATSMTSWRYAAAMGVEGASVTIPFKLDALRAAYITRCVRRRRGRRLQTRSGRDGQLAGSHEHRRRRLSARRSSAVLGDASRDARAAIVLGAGGSAGAVVARIAIARRAGHRAPRRRESRRGRSRRHLGATAGVAAGGRRRGICWSTARRLAARARRDESPLPRETDLTDRWSTTSRTGRRSPLALLPRRRRPGVLTLDGLPMLVAQAERQFEWWTDRSRSRAMAGGAASQLGRDVEHAVRADRPRTSE